MTATHGQAPQRVCPHCATVAATGSDRCPWCERSYRRHTVAAVAALLFVQTALILGGIAVALVVAADRANEELDEQVDRVERDFERDLDRIRRDVRRELRSELDRRLPPTVTPSP
jgi:hypothetical protein